MKTEEAIEFLKGQKNKPDNPVEPLRLGINLTLDDIISLLQLGEQYKEIHIGLIEELEERQMIINELKKYKDMWIDNKYYSKTKKIEELEQKYFPEPSKSFTEKVMEKITKKGIYPWWNTLTKDEKMEVYFNYYSSGTYDDCIEWWDKIDIILKIFVHDRWCEK